MACNIFLSSAVQRDNKAAVRKINCTKNKDPTNTRNKTKNEYKLLCTQNLFTSFTLFHGAHKRYEKLVQFVAHSCPQSLVG